MKFKSFLFAAFVSALTLFAVGCSDDDNNVVPDGGGETPEVPDKPDVPDVPVVVPAMEMKDGFLVSDGLDEASGYYRMNIMMSDQKMGSQTYPYYDVMVYVYLKQPLTPVEGDKRRAEVPFGEVTPFYTDGTPTGDMIYYIGRHKQDENGDPSFEGTAWVKWNSENDAEYFVASDVAKTKIQIEDKGNGNYEIHGTLVDSDKNTELAFSFKDSKKVHVVNAME